MPGTTVTPSTPMEEIHLDFKTGLPESGGFRNCLVSICGLTRYVLLMPVSTRAMEEVVRALVRFVFCVFGIPRVVVADNEFRGQLMDALSTTCQLGACSRGMRKGGFGGVAATCAAMS